MLHNPSLISEIDNMLDTYKGKERGLYVLVCKQYHVPPQDVPGAGAGASSEAKDYESPPPAQVAVAYNGPPPSVDQPESWTRGASVSVYSSSHQKWHHDGRVVRVNEVDGYDSDGATLPGGSIYVYYNADTNSKWIHPNHIDTYVKLLPDDEDMF